MFFSEIITDSRDDIPTTTTEVEKFLREPLVDYKTGDPYAWWGQHNREFPILYKLAQRYLSASATSVGCCLQLVTYTMTNGIGYCLP